MFLVMSMPSLFGYCTTIPQEENTTSHHTRTWKFASSSCSSASLPSLLELLSCELRLCCCAFATTSSPSAIAPRSRSVCAHVTIDPVPAPSRLNLGSPTSDFCLQPLRFGPSSRTSSPQPQSQCWIAHRSSRNSLGERLYKRPFALIPPVA
jgi:hypothetical protein